MRYVQLRAFHQVAVQGGFSKAAEILHITQPAVSDQVRKLESEYDVRLFDRRHRQVVLTDIGRSLLELTHRLFEVEQQAVELLGESRWQRMATLRVVADSARHIGKPLARFRERYPEVHVAIRIGNSAQVLEHLAGFEADVGVVGAVPIGRDYRSVTLQRTPLVAFVPVGHAIARKARLSLRELANLPLVLREKGSRTRSLLEQAAAEARVQLRIAIEAEGREAVRDLVLAGVGVGVVSDAEFNESDSLRKLVLAGSRITMQESIVCLRERENNRLIQDFMAIAADSA